MRRSAFLLLFTVGCNALWGVAPDGYERCPEVGYGLVLSATFAIQARDSVTGELINNGTVGYWSAGRSKGTLARSPGKYPDVPTGLHLNGPYGRPGEYEVRLVRPGYRDASLVEAHRAGCRPARRRTIDS